MKGALQMKYTYVPSTFFDSFNAADHDVHLLPIPCYCCEANTILYRAMWLIRGTVRNYF